MPVYALDLAYDESSDLARQLEDVLEFAPDLVTPYVAAAFDRAQTLKDVLGDSRSAFLDLFERAHAGAHALADALATARDRTMDVAEGHATQFTRGVPAAIDIELVKSNDLERLRVVVNDLTGADLHDANLVGVLLDRVRWSDTTRWPEEWAQGIRDNSVSLGGGVYEYRPGTTKAGDLVGALR